MSFKNQYFKWSFHQWRFPPGMAQFAFQSALPSVSTQLLLMGDDSPSTTTTKKEKEQFALSNMPYIWTSHKKYRLWMARDVDYVGFWPADTNGVTEWVALSDMKARQGGGIRIAAPSRHAAWGCPVVGSPPLSQNITQNDTNNTATTTMEPKLRYTIRYIPHGAKVRPKTIGIHPSG